ncbi:hypothetical protein L2E82_49312 [Cichorium intybus]|uniref:Uncharacterized protein n=1 Tax=Cichorium intybus TaxID=13427 RepID=A0ACB8Z1E4_CICIN|nr:hypothetical protein L2E82_49312 [Cichorium intybus]
MPAHVRLAYIQTVNHPAEQAESSWQWFISSERKSILRKISQNGRLKVQDDAHVISTKKPISISAFLLKISRQIIEYPGFHLI